MPRTISRISLVLLALASLASAGQAAQVFTLTTQSFGDLNANGLIDCGEPVNVQAGLFDNNAAPGVDVTGRLTIPSAFGSEFSFSGFHQDNSLTNKCLITTISGASGGIVTVDYVCTGSAAPSDNYAVALVLQGTYIGPSGPISFQGTNVVSSPVATTTLVNYLESRTNPCLFADLQLTKSDGGITSAPGQTVPYTLTVANRGNTSATGTVLTETVPLHTTFNAGVSSPGWICASPSAGSACTLPIGTLVTGGGTTSRIFAVDVGLNLPAGVTQIDNTASVTSTVADANPADNTASDSTPLNPGVPDLTVKKSTTSTGATPGSSIVWSLAVSNSGNGSAAAVSLTETIPASTSFDSSLSSPGWSCAGASCTLAIGTVSAATTVTRAFGVRVASPVPAALSSITNTACASTTTLGDPPGNNCGSTSTPVGGSPRLQVSKAVASGSGTPGTTVVWAITAVNTGDRDAGTVTLQEIVPQATTFNAGLSSPGWSCSGSSAGSTCTLTLPSLAGAGGSATRNFATTIASTLPAGLTMIDNIACATTAGSADACSTVSIPTDGSAHPTIHKSLTSGNGAPGSLLVYTLTAQNTGDQDATNVLVQETVGSSTTWSSAQSSPGWSCSGAAAGSTCSLTIATLAAGATTTRTFAVVVDNPLPAGVSSLQNTVCISLSGSPLCDTVVITPVAAPVLQVQKVLTAGTAAAGQTVLYTVTIQNTGNQNDGPSTVTDTIPAGTSWIAGGSSGWNCSPTPRAPSTCTMALPGLAAGASTTLQIAFSVDATTPAGQTTLVNQACASDGRRNACATTSDPLTPSGSSALKLTKTYSGPPLRPGATVPFTLTLTNTGSASANAVRLREIVPAGVTFSAGASAPGWSCNGTTEGSACTYAVASLAAGASASVVFAVLAPNPLPPNLRQVANAACVVDAAGSSIACDQTSTPLDVAVTATLDDSLVVDNNHDSNLSTGDTLRYTLVVTNPSSQAATALVITTQIDPHVQLITGSVVTSDGTISAGNTTGDTLPTVLLPSLAPGASVTITFEVLAEDLSGLRVISSQSRISGSNIEDKLSDDPETPAPDDPTLTPVLGPAIASVPTLGRLELGILTLLLGGTACLFLRRRAPRTAP